ncbi:MAG: GAF domain-containing sensor histidine kinase [Armatimonadetes bacterium]|nr:GAF domain-containing sensor histidine kinase [Armatimonadota bacterium]
MTASKKEQIFDFCLFAIFLGVFALSLRSVRVASWVDFLVFFVLLLLFYSIRVPLPGVGIYFCLALPAFLSTVLVMGPSAAWIALLVTIADSVIHRSRWQAVLFNVYHDFLCVSVSAWVYSSCGGQTPLSTLQLHSLVPGFAASATFFVTDFALTNTRLAVALGKPPWRRFYDMKFALLDTALFPLGFLVALCYSSWSVSGLLLVGLPLLLAALILGFALKGSGQMDELRVILDTASEVNSSLDLERILKAIASRIAQVLSPEECLIAVLRGDQEVWMVADGRDRKEPVLYLPVQDLAVAREELNRLQEETAGQDSSSFPFLDSQFYAGKAPKVFFPVKGEGETAGLIVRVTRSLFFEEHRELIAILSQQGSSAIKNAKMYTDLKAAQAQIIQSGKMAALGQLAAGVAHEVNNPLGAIMTSVDLISDDDTDPELRREGVQLIKQGITRCKEIVNHLLQYAHQGGPDQDSPADQIVEAKQVVEKTLVLFLESFRRLGIEVMTEYDSHSLVRGSPQELNQLLTNLLLNAKDAIVERREKEGSGFPKDKAKISIKTRSDGVYAYMEVQDNGIGIPPKTLPKIFDPFFTTKEVGKGSGLGLANALSIAKKYGGDIRVSSKAGDTLFSAKFPEIKRKERIHTVATSEYPRS